MNDSSSQEMPKTNWGPIIKDLFILMCVMGTIGFLCKLAMEPFEEKSPTDSLVSLIRKGDVKLQDQQASDQHFLKELNILNAKVVRDKMGVNISDRTGRTPLMWAVYANFNNPQDALKVDAKRLYYVFSLLKAPNIDIHQRDIDGFTAMHWAAWSGLHYNLTLLANAGVDVNARENAGYTPLMLAAMRGNADAVAALLALGADASQERIGRTAADLAQEACASYDKNSAFFYSLIYSDERAANYDRTLKLLKAGKSDTPAMTNDELYQVMLNAVQESEKTGQKATEQAEEKKQELEVEKAAAAPPDTDADQAPSAQVE